MKTIFRYRLLDNLKSLLVLLAVLLLVPVVLTVIADGRGGTQINMMGSMSGTAWALVIGIVVTRIDLRLGNQLGVSRRSAFLGNLLGCAVSFAAGAAAMATLTAVLQLLTEGGEIAMMDLYQLLYSGSASYVMPLGEYVFMALLQFATYLCAGAFGMLCTLAFWRLGKLGKWVLGAGMGLFFILGIPNLFFHLEPHLLRPVRILATNPLAMGLLLLALAVLFLAGSWLLARRTPILAPAKA